MRWKLLILSMLIIPVMFLSFPGCRDMIFRTITSEAKSLDYVGQVKITGILKESGQVLVSLKYSGGQWLENSAIVPYKVDVVINEKEREIEITVVTAIVSDKKYDNGHQFSLPGSTSGEYTVFYLNPDNTRHNIGSIKVPDCKN